MPSSIRTLSFRITTLLLLAALALAGLSCENGETYHPPHGEGPWILVDLYHTRIQNPEDYRLTKGNYQYQGVFGYHRLFAHLNDQGYKWTSIREMPLSAPRLKGFDVLFINLVHDSRPDFSQDEIKAIQEFVFEGGGLFIIADHTNVYRHAERINPILEPMGIQAFYHTAVDVPPTYSVGGSGWIMIRNFADHPVTAELDTISFQTGGPIDSEHGVAFTSDQSYADFWNEEESSGFYGNWKFDGDPELEPRGPLNAVAAAEYGKGRVVVAGDQNMFGDAWLHFANNFELALNTFEWTAQQDQAPTTRLRDTRPAGLHVAVNASKNDYNTGRTGAEGFYNFFVHMNRDINVTASATTRIGADHDALIFLSPTIAFEQDEIAAIRQHLNDGKRVILTTEATSISPATTQLLQEFAPDFELSYPGATIQLAQDGPTAFHNLKIPRIDGAHELQSDKLDLNNIQLASAIYSSKDDDDNNPAEIRYLLDTTSNWGTSLISARNQTANGSPSIDIARAKLVEGGELIIFLQDGFFRNRTMGYKETRPPKPHAQPSVDLQYVLLDYLKTSVP